MNNRQLEAARHKRELNNAKCELQAKVNQQVQSAKSKGYETRIAPQLLRLLGIKSYRRREVQSMTRLINDFNKMAEYIAVIEPTTGELISGGQALERYSRYEQSAIYHRVEPEEIPIEAERTLSNFAESVEEAFPDDSVYQQFISYLDRAIDQDTTIADESLWKMHHDSIDIYESGHSKSAKGIQSSKQFWLFNNHENIQEISSALARLINLEGERTVVERLRDAGDNIIDDLVTAAIGYNQSSARAVQSILNVLLPSSVRSQAMSMSDIPEVDDFNYEERY